MTFLASALSDPLVEEVIVLGGGRTFVVREGVKRLVPEVIDDASLRAFVDRLLAGTGRRLDLASPIVSAQLEDGSRVHITGPPVTHPARMNVQIRRFVLAAGGLDRLVELGSMPQAVALELRWPAKTSWSITCRAHWLLWQTSSFTSSARLPVDLFKRSPR